MTSSLFVDDAPDCPQCRESNPLPILYGTPSDEMVTASKLGHIVLGGEDNPDPRRLWQCQSVECRYQF